MTRRQATVEPLLNSAALCEYLGWSASALYVRRHRGDAPPAIRTGKRSLRWRRSDVDRWLDAHQESETPG